MASLTLSYGLVSPQSPDKRNAHILPISRILHPALTDEYYLTTSRDGSVVLHPCAKREGAASASASTLESSPTRFQVHSDWVSDIVEINLHSYVSVSHDFSVVHIALHRDPQTLVWHARTQIIGSHRDYIKCISYFPRLDMLVTGGLDCAINLWSVSYPLGPSAAPEFRHYHSFDTEGASIYTLAVLRGSGGGSDAFDLVAGDCNGDLAFYSAANKRPVKRIQNAHETNIKTMRLVDGESRLVSTCSNGVVHVWSLAGATGGIARLKSWKWGCSIWCIDGDSSGALLVGDSLGNINRFDISDLDNIRAELVFNSKQYCQQYATGTGTGTGTAGDRHLGILDLKLLNDTNIFFSYCSDSNLNCLNLRGNTLSTERGGFALTRSSLLTNRRHVITENTQGKVQRWDIVSCELINTFDAADGTFDSIVVQYTSKEILSHWCTVSVKVGMLFVKISPRFSNTELYGSALTQYAVMNDVKINGDDRYNIGKIVMNSLFNEFMHYEQKKDQQFRKGLVNSKKKEHEDKQLDGAHSPVDAAGAAAAAASAATYQGHGGSGTTTPKAKDKFRKMSAFSKLGSSISMGNSNKPETPFVSAPTTPIDKDKQLHHPHELNAGGRASRTAPLGSTAAVGQPTFDQDLGNGEIVNPVPVLSKNGSGRAQSSGSLLSRKFKSFRLSKNDSNMSSEDSKHFQSDDDDTTTATTRMMSNEQVNLSIDSDIPEERTIWNKGYNATDRKEDSPFYNSKANDSQNPVYAKLNDESKAQSRSHSTSTLNVPSRPVPAKQEKKTQFMSDLMNEFHNSYTEQYTGNMTSLKMLTRKMPDSLIKRDPSSPIVRIKLATLIVVHSWEADVSGGSVLSSNILPPTPKRRHVSSDHSSETSSISVISDPNTHLAGDRSHDADCYNETTLNGGEPGDEEMQVTSSKRELFDRLEHDLPYWFAKSLCNDIRRVDDQQPKLNFILAPWLNAEQEARQALEEPTENAKPEQRHYMLKFGKSKGTGITDLPKISDMNARLTAPGMIKVKKIKFYVIDRFEAKTPEMKAKLDPSEWLEILCKGQVLDNDMTLSTVRTLFWKSQGEIVLNYRRKMNALADHQIAKDS